MAYETEINQIIDSNIDLEHKLNLVLLFQKKKYKNKLKFPKKMG